MVIRFGTCALDEERRHLLRDGTPVHLTPKAFDLLLRLVSEAPRVVSKRELHEHLWPDSFVSDTTLVGLVKEIRRALDDTHPEAPIIRTVHRIGYACCLEATSFSARSVSEAPRARRVWHWLVFHGRRVMLHDGQNVVGRDPASDVCLDSTTVPRRHAHITIDGDQAQLEDLASKNGTSVTGARIERPVLLRDADAVAFGAITGIYRTSASGMSTETHLRRGPREEHGPHRQSP
jgi:DNA-binding winged helix-turn-helix (wHTH) protein